LQLVAPVEVGSSGTDGQPPHVEFVHASGIAGGDLGCSSSGTPAKIFRVWGNGEALRPQGPQTALCSRPLTARRMGEDAPKPTPMITLTNGEVGWISAVPNLPGP